MGGGGGGGGRLACVVYSNNKQEFKSSRDPAAHSWSGKNIIKYIYIRSDRLKKKKKTRLYLED